MAFPTDSSESTSFLDYEIWIKPFNHYYGDSRRQPYHGFYSSGVLTPGLLEVTVGRALTENVPDNSLPDGNRCLLCWVSSLMSFNGRISMRQWSKTVSKFCRKHSHSDVPELTHAHTVVVILSVFVPRISPFSPVFCVFNRFAFYPIKDSKAAQL